MPLSSGAASTQHSVSQIPSWHMQTKSLAMSGSSAGKRFFEARDARPQIATERSFLLVETESKNLQMPAPNRGYSANHGKSRLAPECVVADAVAFEPVSTLKFPANREKNREFHQIRALGAILKADTRANSEACSEFP